MVPAMQRLLSCRRPFFHFLPPLLLRASDFRPQRSREEKREQPLRSALHPLNGVRALQARFNLSITVLSLHRFFLYATPAYETYGPAMCSTFYPSRQIRLHQTTIGFSQQRGLSAKDETKQTHYTISAIRSVPSNGSNVDQPEQLYFCNSDLKTAPLIL